MPGNDFWKTKRIIVTGGAGFLGSFVVKALSARGARDILIPRIEHYDFTKREDVLRLLEDAMLPIEKRAEHLLPGLQGFRPSNLENFKPSDLVILHLAAQVGGIGANLEHPADFFYDNLMMGVQLMHEGYRFGT